MLRHLIALLAGTTLLLIASSAQALELGVQDGGLVANGTCVQDRARELGATYARFIVGYGNAPLQNQDACVAGAVQAGLKVQITFRPDHSTLPAYLASHGAFRWWVRRYPQVNIWSYGNEPELLNVKPCQYRRDYLKARRILHEEHPGDTLLFGETSPHGGLEYVRKVLACSDKPLRVDGWAIHPYQPRTDPLAIDTTSKSLVGGKWMGIGRLPMVRRWLARKSTRRHFSTPRGGTVPFYITEFGYFTRNVEDKQVAISETQAAAWWPRAIIQAARVHARVIVAYGLDAQPDRSIWDTSLVRADGTRRAAFAAIASASRSAA